jgi:hypothetical protein
MKTPRNARVGNPIDRENGLAWVPDSVLVVCDLDECMIANALNKVRKDSLRCADAYSSAYRRSPKPY